MSIVAKRRTFRDKSGSQWYLLKARLHKWLSAKKRTTVHVADGCRVVG